MATADARFFGDKFLPMECTLEAETSVSNLTQYKRFIGDDKKIRSLEWPPLNKQLIQLLAHWLPHQTVRDPLLISGGSMEYFKASESTKINHMRSNNRHKIRFQDFVYLKFKGEGHSKKSIFLPSPIKRLYWVKLLTKVSASKLHSIARNLSLKKRAPAATILKQMLSGQVGLGR